MRKCFHYCITHACAQCPEQSTQPEPLSLPGSTIWDLISVSSIVLQGESILPLLKPDLFYLLSVFRNAW